MLSPQHSTVPPVSSAHALPKPTATDVAPLRPGTGVGTVEPKPQQSTLPPVSTTQVWEPPAAMAMTPDSPLMAVGTFTSVVVPLPS